VWVCGDYKSRVRGCQRESLAGLTIVAQGLERQNALQWLETTVLAFKQAEKYVKNEKIVMQRAVSG
jgi:hypothetical protein